jgi:hypothetical protein
LRIIVCVSASLLLACIGTGASEQDCGLLGDKFVDLYMAELSEDAQKLPPEVLESAAAAGRQEVVSQCKAKSTPKATIKRCLAVETLDAFRNC